MSDEPKILVPKRLIENLIHCIKVQRTVTELNEKTAVNETQFLINSTIYWAKSFLSSKGDTPLEITLEEALEFVKVQKDSVSCDFIESHKCREIIVDPEYPEEL